MSNTKMNANSPESNRKRQLPESFLLLGLGIWKVTETKELFQLPTDQSGQNVVLFVFLPLQTLHICLKNRAWHVGVWPEHVSPVCTRLKTLLLLCLTIELPISAFLSVDISQKIFVIPLFFMRFWKSWGDRPRKITDSSFTRKSCEYNFAKWVIDIPSPLTEWTEPEITL